MPPSSIASRRLRAALTGAVAALAGLVLAEEPQRRPAALPPAQPAEQKPSEAAEARVLVLPGASPDLVILHTGNVVGYVEPCGCPINPSGGLGRRAGYLGMLKEKFPKTIVSLVDTGDFAGDPDEAGRYKTQNLIQGMREMGYDAINVGTRELAGGVAAFRTLMENSGLNFINANFVYRDNLEPVLPPTVTRQVTLSSGRAITIGFLGLNSFDSTFAKETPEGRVVVMREPAQALERYLPDLRGRSDLVVLLGNLVQRDLDALLSGERGVDLALVSHGTRVSPNGALEDVHGVPVLYSGDQGKRVGEVRVSLGDAGAKPQFFAHHVLLTTAYPAEPRLQMLVEGTIAKVNEIRKQAAGMPGSAPRTVPPVLQKGGTTGASTLRRQAAEPAAEAAEEGRPFVTASGCATCHASAFQTWYGSAHAHAFDVLVKANQDFNPECVGCHVTGFDKRDGFLNVRQTPDLAHVQCEACHGNGGAHVSNPQAPYGKVAPRECFTCHNKENSPDFVFFKYWDRIKH